ncbi:MAG: molybdopterin-synthase adenylyltransferase MoeB [Nitrospinota bacterium]|jgi:adenylyltransferase/sulfurtransferase|nr:molybdopterin-synthase adenylyltransferase MoeB [Nitrospinota bacterium]MDP7580279.1 molybdopterin-synthase adenylyltransferase MoeB [Nitrospinota bacterium]HJN03203.1 molybdopterin-synthase adenylyltransferase MoeB [Nitrospinota bacterium]
MNLTNEQISRYSRHLILPEVGVVGQEKLREAKVLCIGSGGLGSPIILYLAAAGVGKLGIVDFDHVELSNLQRQIIHGEDWVGKSKNESAKSSVKALNSDIKITTYNERLTSQNAMEIIKDYDIVVDGTDNFSTRYLVNDATVLLKKPNVYGSIFRFEGQASVFFAEKGPCYRCLYPAPPPPGMVPSCAEGGVLGILPGIIGLIQSTEIIKLILNKGDSLIGRLLLFQAMPMKFRELRLKKDPDCPVCSKNATIKELIDYDEFCSVGRGEENVKETDISIEITTHELKKLIDEKLSFTLIDVREPHEYQICRIEGATLMPLATIANQMAGLDQTGEIITYCHAGMRSYKAAEFLKSMGFGKVRSLKGGIKSWSRDIDPSIPVY